jgi:hypothetical protein
MRTTILTFIIFSLIVSCKQNKTDKKAQEISTKKTELTASIQIPSNKNEVGKMNNVDLGCGYNYAFEENDLEIYLPNTREVDIINKILSYSGIPSNFEIYKANIENAVATIIENRRYILYDERLFNYADNSTKSRWSSISILAHEIGHHLSGHTLSSSSDQLKAELEADKFSGFILYKMGASLEDASKAIDLMGTLSDTETHPSKRKRIQAIKKGWNEANRQRYEAALPPPPNDDDAEFYTFNSPMLIDEEHIEYAKEISSDFYTDYDFLYGIVTDVDKDFSSFRVRIIRMKNTDDYWRDITGEEWDVVMDRIGFLDNNEMCHACTFNFKALMIPGRRLKFSMVEAYPGAGTSMNGVWFLTYAERLNGNAL